MISLADAQARLFALSDPLDVEHVRLADAAGRWTAEPVRAHRTQPAHDLSAMDGYAIRYADLPGPWKVTGESAAGRHFEGLVRKGEAVRIFTGAALPEGADTVIVQEDVKSRDKAIALSGEGPADCGAHVRTAGSDFREGGILIPEGQRLSAAAIGLAALAGLSGLSVRRRPRVALISTGDELVPPGAAIGRDQIPASNAAMLAALLGDMPVIVDDRGIVPDRLPALTTAFGKAGKADIIVTIGGASVGEHDLVRPALEMAGAKLDFWKVAMRPGKPVMAGMLGKAIVLGLPGNPVSAYVTALLFLKPLIAHLGGAADPLPPRHNARAGAALPANGDRIDHIRAIWRDGVATPVGGNDSAMLAALTAANALIVRGPNATPAKPGEAVDLIAL